MPELLPLSLEARGPARIRPDLERLRGALELLGAPQRSFPSMLVVGTNGKGSTVAIVERLLAQHGLTVGLYSSPHLVRVEERIRIAGETIATAALERQLARLDRFANLTFFETLTAAALLEFAEAGVDCAVLEAGMGGRWDATRVAASAIAGLTNVGSDHVRWLGERLEDRAADKGSALAAASFAVIGPQVTDEVRRHLGAPAARRADELVAVQRLAGGGLEASWDSSRIPLELPLAGSHQVHNLQLALALARCATQAGWIARLEPAAVARAVAGVRWPGRLTWHRVDGRRVLVDCAHNAEGAAALADHLSAQPVLFHLLFSCLDDKPVEAMADALGPCVGNVVVCPLDDQRAMALDRLLAAFPEAIGAPSAAAGLRLLPAPIVVAGSVRLVGELLAGNGGVG